MVEEIRVEEMPRSKDQQLVAYFPEEQFRYGVVLNKTNRDALRQITGSDDPQDAVGTWVELYNDPAVRNPQTGEYGAVRIRRAPVAIYDANGKRRTDFDSAVTDANGYFELATSELLRPGDARVQPSEESGQKVTLEVRIFDARRRALKHFLPTIDALPGRVDFREILVDTSSQAAAVPPDTVAKGPQAPGPVSRRDLREKLNIVADELRKKPQFTSVRSTILAARQKPKKAKSQKQQKRPMVPRKKRRSKKRKSQ
jgi:hypothetical protein